MKILHKRPHDLLERTRIKKWLTTDNIRKLEWMTEYLIKHPLEITNRVNNSTTDNPIVYIETADDSYNNEKTIERMKAGWRTKKYKEKCQIIPVTLSLTDVAEKKLRNQSKQVQESKSQFICNLLINYSEALERHKNYVKLRSEQSYNSELAKLNIKIQHLNNKINNQKSALQYIYQSEADLSSIISYLEEICELAHNNQYSNIYHPPSPQQSEIINKIDTIKNIILNQQKSITNALQILGKNPMDRIYTGTNKNIN